MAEESEWSTLHVSNIPLETNRNQLEAVFSDLGPIKKCFVVKCKPDSKTTIGFVTFAMQEDCRAALDKDDFSIEGKSLKIKIAPDSKKKDRKPKGGDNNEETVSGSDPASSDGAAVASDSPNAANKQQQQHRSNPRKSRLIIRNLSFKVTDEKLRAYFSKFGELTEVNILKKPNGLLVGCAFIQFSKVNQSAKAIKETNAKPFLGRPIAVDWAVPKEVFKGTQDTKKTDNKEENEDDEASGDEEKEGGGEDEPEDDEEDDDDSEEDDDGSDDSGVEDVEEPRKKVEHNLSTGHDVDQGKTVFIKNLAFETDEEDLRDMMEEIFGPVHFAKLVMDKVMHHPRGTGFVKFKKAEDAAKCIEVSEGNEGLYLDSRKLNCCLAIKKDDVEQMQKERKEKEAKDSRNLYLAREGIIREGTKAAEGVSATDLAKRRELERYKKNILKNLHMFVSKTRLCIRNLPPTFDDKQLKKLIASHVPRSATINEAKVIRDMNKVVSGKGVSKEFGFVSFKEHEHALAALRSLNNNPNVFSADKRPIVDFAIENKKALDARQKRLEKSRMNNPNFKAKSDGKSKTSDQTSKGKASQKHSNKGNTSEADTEAGASDKKDFSGLTADPKVKTLPKHTGAKVRHKQSSDGDNQAGAKNKKITRKMLRKQELDRKNPRKRKMAQESHDQPGQHQSNNPPTAGPPEKKAKKSKHSKMSKEDKRDFKENKDFDALVNTYRNKFASNERILKKWFE